MQDLSITLLQPELAWLDPVANRSHLSETLAALPGRGSLVILPEMFTTGFTLKPADCAEDMDGPSVAWMAETARQYDTTLCGSLVIRDRDKFHNRLVWMPPGGELRWYDKRHLFRMAGEQHHYTAGTERPIMQINGWRVCPLICYDLRFPVWSRGANLFDLQIFVANWPAPRASAWRALLPARAVENQCYCVGVNRVGRDGNAVDYQGDSMVVDYFGNVLADLGATENAVTLRLDGAGLTRYREKFPAWRDADRFHVDS